MKKLLTPSILLAGLLICLPTHSAKADYQPYSYGSIRNVSQSQPTHSNGFASSFTFDTTPGPAVLFASASGTASAPSGASGDDWYSGISWENNAFWNWTGGGTPANFTETRAVQLGAQVKNYTGSGAATGGFGFYGLIQTGRNGSASVSSAENFTSIYNSDGGTYTPQLVQSTSKLGSAYIWASYTSDVDAHFGVNNGGSYTVSVLGQLGVSYTTP